MDIEDKLLYFEIKNRNLKLYESLFHFYYPKLVRFAEGYIFDKHESEDIVQNLFLYFWENADEIIFTTSIKSYLYQSVKNRCLNHLRDLNIRDRHNILYLEALIRRFEDEEMMDTELMNQIIEAIEQLPDQMADIFKLKYLEGKKIKEIVKINNVTVNTVKTHLKRAKSKLQKNLSKVYLNNLF